MRRLLDSMGLVPEHRTTRHRAAHEKQFFRRLLDAMGLLFVFETNDDMRLGELEEIEIYCFCFCC